MIASLVAFVFPVAAGEKQGRTGNGSSMFASLREDFVIRGMVASNIQLRTLKWSYE
jgi:hypothetical protein